PAGVSLSNATSSCVNGIATFKGVTITGTTAAVLAASPYTLTCFSTLAGVPDTENASNTTKVLDVTDATQTTNPAQLLFPTKPLNVIAGAQVGAPTEVTVQLADVAGTPIKTAGVPIRLDVNGGARTNNFGYRFGFGQLNTSTTLTANTDANGIARFID